MLKPVSKKKPLTMVLFILIIFGSTSGYVTSRELMFAQHQQRVLTRSINNMASRDIRVREGEDPEINNSRPYIRDVRADSRQSRIDARDIRTDFREIRTELSFRAEATRIPSRIRNEVGRNSREIESRLYRDGSNVVRSDNNRRIQDNLRTNTREYREEIRDMNNNGIEKNLNQNRDSRIYFGKFRTDSRIVQNRRENHRVIREEIAFKNRDFRVNSRMETRRQNNEDQELKINSREINPNTRFDKEESRFRSGVTVREILNERRVGIVNNIPQINFKQSRDFNRKTMHTFRQSGSEFDNIRTVSHANTRILERNSQNRVRDVNMNPPTESREIQHQRRQIPRAIRNSRVSDRDLRQDRPLDREIRRDNDEKNGRFNALNERRIDHLRRTSGEATRNIRRIGEDLNVRFSHDIRISENNRRERSAQEARANDREVRVRRDAKTSNIRDFLSGKREIRFEDGELRNKPIQNERIPEIGNTTPYDRDYRKSRNNFISLSSDGLKIVRFARETESKARQHSERREDVNERKIFKDRAEREAKEFSTQDRLLSSAISKSGSKINLIRNNERQGKLSKNVAYLPRLKVDLDWINILQIILATAFLGQAVIRQEKNKIFSMPNLLQRFGIKQKME